MKWWVVFFFLRFIARLHWKIWTIRVYSLFLSLSEKLFTRISENICLLVEFLKEKVFGIGILLILLDLGFLVFSCTLNFQSFGGIFINHLWSSREFIVRDDLFDSQFRRGRGGRFRKLLETCLYMQACFRYSNCGWEKKKRNLEFQWRLSSMHMHTLNIHYIFTRVDIL